MFQVPFRVCSKFSPGPGPGLVWVISNSLSPVPGQVSNEWVQSSFQVRKDSFTHYIYCIYEKRRKGLPSWLMPEICLLKFTWTKSTRQNPPIWNPPTQNPPSWNPPAKIHPAKIHHTKIHQAKIDPVKIIVIPIIEMLIIGMPIIGNLTYPNLARIYKPLPLDKTNKPQRSTTQASYLLTLPWVIRGKTELD